MKIPISKSEVEIGPENYWNSINEFLSESDLDPLTGMLRNLHLVYWYHTGVLFDGLEQYLENLEASEYDQVLAALETLNLGKHAEYLKNAIGIYKRIQDASSEDEEFELGEKLEELGCSFEDVGEDLADYIEQTVRENEENLVEWIR